VREPKLYQGAFDCPHCRAFSKHDWFVGVGHSPNEHQLDARLEEIVKPLIHNRKPRFTYARQSSGYEIVGLNLSTCTHCKEMTIWEGLDCIYPRPRTVEQPNPDMPASVRAEYEEAASILYASPRGATALLRLALEKLCIELGYHGKINTSIGAMVKKGLDPRIQMALDALRVIGNEAVHPGTLDLRDDGETARKLFTLLNLIVEGMISHDKHVESLYNMLTPEQIKGIENRDKDSKGG
jgi:hypothetical protein